MTAWWGPGVMQIDGVRNCGCTCYRPYAEKQCLHGLIVRYWQAAYDGQRDVTGRAGLMVSRTAPVHEGKTRMLHPPAPGRRTQQ